MGFVDDLKAEFEADKPTASVDVTLNGNLYTLVFQQMDGIGWAEATDQAPVRPGVLLDMRYGYNLRALTLIVAPKTGKRRDGDDLVEMTADQWRNLLKALPGASVNRIGDALFSLNEYGPAEAVEALKKASPVGLGLNSD